MVEPLTAAEADDACFDIRFSRKFVEKYYGKAGYIYVARNDAHRANIYKVGLTTRNHPQRRIDELNKEARCTANLGYLALVRSYRVKDCGRTEQRAHELLSSFRCDRFHEFFEADLSVIERAIRSAIAQVTPPEQLTLDDELQKQRAAQQQAQAAAERLRQQQAQEEQRRRQEQEQLARQRQEAEQQRRQALAAQAQERHKAALSAAFPPPSAWQCWLWSSAIVWALLCLAAGGIQPAYLIVAAVTGVLVGPWLGARLEKSVQKTPRYQHMLAQQEQEISCILAGLPPPHPMPAELPAAPGAASESANRGGGWHPVAIALAAVMGMSLAVTIAHFITHVITHPQPPVQISKPQAAANVSSQTAEQQLERIMEAALQRWPYLTTTDGLQATREIIQERDRLLAQGHPPAQALQQAINTIAPRHAPAQ